MKMKILLLIGLILAPIWISAQVTIGSHHEPEDGTLLDLKENNNGTINSTNSIKGLGIPRVMLSNQTELYPMYGQTGYEEEEYTLNKATLKKKHAGLTVYNLTESALFIPGFYLWDGDRWLINELVATPPPSVDELMCGSAKMYPSTFQANTQFSCIFTLPYLGGNGGRYAQFDDKVEVNAVQTVSGTPVVTDFKVRVAEGTLAIGNGQIILVGEGTLPSATEPFVVEINLFGQSCSITMNHEETETGILRYKSGTFLDVTTSSTTEEVAMGNIAIRYNNGYYEYKLIGPDDGKAKADVSWLYRKTGSGGHGYGVYGRYYPDKNTWNSIGYRYRANIFASWEGVLDVGVGSVGSNLASNANINLANRDIAVAHFFIQTDKSHDVYRVTFNANTAIAAGTNAPSAKSAISIIIERLEDHGDGGADLD